MTERTTRIRGLLRPRRVHDLGRRRARRDAPADAADLRGARPDRAAPLGQGDAALLARGRRAAAPHPADDGRARAQPRRRRAGAAARGAARRAPGARLEDLERQAVVAKRAMEDELERVRRSVRFEVVPYTGSTALVRNPARGAAGGQGRGRPDRLAGGSSAARSRRRHTRPAPHHGRRKPASRAPRRGRGCPDLL